jgi:phage tail-like protein
MNITAHAVLCDRRRWRGERRALDIGSGGELTLARVPAPADGKAVDVATVYPCARDVSGLALGPCDGVFVADTAHDRILFVDARCGEHAWLPSAQEPVLDAPGHFASPRGLAVGADGLLVADSGHQALQQLAFPALEPNLQLHAPGTPVSVAIDSRGRVLVVDRAASRLLRVLPGGEIDQSFTARVQQPTRLRSPLCVATGPGDSVWIVDDVANEVFVFDDQGRALHSLTGPGGWLPAAVAVNGDTAYVADAASGAIFFFRGTALQGQVAGWRGPVTALAIGESGDLYVKPGLDAAYHRFAAASAFVDDGELRAGPFDAGEGRCWERAWFDADVPRSSSLDVEVALREHAGAPHATEWRALPCADVLLSQKESETGRFAWVRARLHAGAAAVSPVLRQLRFATSAEDYLDHLPLAYRRHDEDGFLARWLKLLRGEFSRIEEAIEDFPRLADPDFTPSDTLHWLAEWLGFEVPPVVDDGEARALVARAVSLFARRGTPASIAEFVALHTGVRPAIVEAFTERRVWVLGVASRLDFDTRLAPFEPTGLQVPDPAGQSCPPGPIGAAVVGASGPLQEYQIGLPLFSDAAYRFCVVVDACRVGEAGLLEELRRIVEREKPAHTDYRIEIVAPELRIGLQARIGIDAIVGEPRAGGLDTIRLGFDSLLPRADAARAGDARLDGSLTLT